MSIIARGPSSLRIKYVPGINIPASNLINQGAFAEAFAMRPTFGQLSTASVGQTAIGFPVRMDQFLGALEASGAGRVDDLTNLIPPSRSSPLARAFHAQHVPEGGVLASFVASAGGLNLSSLQMAAIFAAARLITL
jgi:hypothetical protein